MRLGWPRGPILDRFLCAWPSAWLTFYNSDVTSGRRMTFRKIYFSLGSLILMYIAIHFSFETYNNLYNMKTFLFTIKLISQSSGIWSHAFTKLRKEGIAAGWKCDDCVSFDFEFPDSFFSDTDSLSPIYLSEEMLEVLKLIELKYILRSSHLHHSRNKRNLLQRILDSKYSKDANWSDDFCDLSQQPDTSVAKIPRID